MAQIVDHRDLISSFQPGDLSASERIVRVYQNEMVRTAFLLTGSPEGAVLLARDTFLDYFRKLARGDTPDDPRLGLMQQFRQSFLIDAGDQPDNGDEPEGLLAGTITLAAEQQRYRVEDDRSRVISLLDLLDRPTRLGIVLRDFNALDEEEVCQILDEVPFTLRQRLHPARDRIRDAAGVGPDYSVRELLVNSATAAPRPNLWPEVIGPLEDYYAEEDERRQRLTYVAAGLVGLLLLLAGLWLFDLLPFGGGDDAAAIAPTAGPTATPTATPEPTITPTPIPELSSFAIPQGDVPSRLIMNIFTFDGSPQRNDYGYFDLASNTFQPYAIDGFGTPSPDGRKLVGIEVTVAESGDGKYALVALDSESADVLWSKDIPRTSYSLAVTSKRVFLAVLPTSDSDADPTPTPELRAYDLESGELIETWPGVIPANHTPASNFFRVVLFASPDEERLFIATEEFDSGSLILSSRSLTSFSLPDMTIESSNIQSDSAASQQFPASFSFYDAHVTPDGRFIYRVDNDEEIVQFRSSDVDEDLDLPMPFVQERESEEQIQWITSNDGRYLYVLALRRAEVVIVDLLARRVTRIFPLDFGASMTDQAELLRSQRPTGIGFAAGMSISQDGQKLYVASVSPIEGGTIDESHLWTIDLATWTVTNVLAVPGFLFNSSEIDNSLLLLSDLDRSTGRTNRLVSLIDPATGAVQYEFSGDGLPDWGDGFFTFALHEYYRFKYARAAAVDHVAYGDVETASTLPRMSVVGAGATVPSGKSFDLAVRALNPADGQRLTEETAGVRFDGDSTVIVRLVHEEGAGDPVILVTNRTDFGRYLASTTLEETGFWNAQITVTGTDGRSWSFTFARAFQIVPSWEASNGKRYVLRVSTDPSQPEVDQVVAITAQFVDIDRGEPLPDDSEILVGFIDQIRVAFDSNGSGVAAATLLRGEDGLYRGDETFWVAGDWEVSIDLRIDGGERVTVGAGTVTVID